MELHAKAYVGGLASSGALPFAVEGMVFVEGLKPNRWGRSISRDVECILARLTTSYADTIERYATQLR